MVRPSASHFFALTSIVTLLPVASPRGSAADETSNEVVVSSTPADDTLFSSARPVSVLEGDELARRAQGSLGQTLSGEPGVASSYFGPGSARPVIRGLGGDRIRILENGVGTLDVSNTSPDHAVNVEPGAARKIEILRGPAALLYGTSAVGGLVNVLDGRVPDLLPPGPVSGTAEIRGGTVDRERAGFASLDAPAGPFAVNVRGSARRSGDYDVPGYALSPRLRDPEGEGNGPRGRVPFSAVDNDSASVGASYVGDTGFLGAAVSEFNTNYGVPNGEEDVSIDGNRRRLDVRGEVRPEAGFLKLVSVRAGAVDYEHTEFEGAEAGTKFRQDGVDSRAEFSHRAVGPFEGTFGLQYQGSDFEAIGEESFQPPTDTDVYSLFLFETTPLGDRTELQLGARYDRSGLETPGRDGGEGASGPADRTFDSFSQSAGLVWRPADRYVTALSVAHTERAPSGQELFADGPHVATGAFEIGDQGLPEERSVGVDLSLRKREGLVRGSVGGFYNRFWNYVNLASDGTEEDDLPVFRFAPVDADFVGAEAEMSVHPIDEPGRGLSFDLRPDYVRATDRSNDSPLPRITPARLRAGAEYADERYGRARIEVQRVFAQNRTSQNETSTDGYTFLNVYLSKSVPVVSRTAEVFVRGTNLLGEKAREHVSFIKDVAPLPGANVVAGVTLRF